MTIVLEEKEEKYDSDDNEMTRAVTAGSHQIVTSTTFKIT